MKKFLPLIVIIILAAVLFGGWRLWHTQRKQEISVNRQTPPESPIDYTMHVLQESAPVVASGSHEPVVAGITSHHLPTAEGFITKMYAQLKERRADIQEFVVVGPDHFERCKTTVSVTTRDFLTAFGPVENDREITKALLDAGAGEDNSCFEKEHSIGVQTAFIKKYYPEARVAGVIFSSATTAQVPPRLAQVLAEKFPEAVVIGSIDFSHYESFQVADQIDQRTQEQLSRMDVDSLRMEQMDSPSSVRFVVAYAKSQGAKVSFMDHINSFSLTNQPDNTTSYFDVLFEK